MRSERSECKQRIELILLSKPLISPYWPCVPASLALKIRKIITNYGYEAKTLQITSLCRKLRACDIKKNSQARGIFFLVIIFLGADSCELCWPHCLPYHYTEPLDNGRDKN